MPEVDGSLDGEVALVVFGCKPREYPSALAFGSGKRTFFACGCAPASESDFEPHGGGFTGFYRYSGSYYYMGKVLDEMRRRGFRCEMRRDLGLSQGARARFLMSSVGGPPVGRGRGDDLPEAVAMAAVAALKGDHR